MGLNGISAVMWVIITCMMGDMGRWSKREQMAAGGQGTGQSGPVNPRRTACRRPDAGTDAHAQPAFPHRLLEQPNLWLSRSPSPEAPEAGPKIEMIEGQRWTAMECGDTWMSNRVFAYHGRSAVMLPRHPMLTDTARVTITC